MESVEKNAILWNSGEFSRLWRKMWEKGGILLEINIHTILQKYYFLWKHK